MKLDKLKSLKSPDLEFKPMHSVEGDVGLVLTLRDYQSRDYRKIMADSYKGIAERFSDSVDANAAAEAVALIKSWNVDELECTPDNIVDLLATDGCMWIAYQVQDWVLGKKLKAILPKDKQ